VVFIFKTKFVFFHVTDDTLGGSVPL
jgi:hypothetical protein